ncbi:Non-muscle caldesmon [Pteropus alecto]|uniref:Non-muscle caldesmon n=1 Tax=Pteropus alecto TaxID=9402 RepID=L5KRH9_PTEAL|nr:Non-muscle caldesmon [Pteropus alecto]
MGRWGEPAKLYPVVVASKVLCGLRHTVHQPQHTLSEANGYEVQTSSGLLKPETTPWMTLNVAENLGGKNGKRCAWKQKETCGHREVPLGRYILSEDVSHAASPSLSPDCLILKLLVIPIQRTHTKIAYQRNDDDEEEAARERRRRARQERLRQKQEEESFGQVTDQVEVNAQNSVPDEVKTTTANTQVEGDDEAAFLERLARREERRQKRLQEALERQKEFDPTITDASLSLPSRRTQNDTEENEHAEKEEISESRQERYEIEETEIVTKSYQKNDWRVAEENKKDEKEKEGEEEEKPKPGSIKENQEEEKGAKVQPKREKSQEDKPTFKKEEIKDEKMKKDKEPREDVKSFLDGKKGFTEVKSQNGEFVTHKLKHTENTFSRPGGRAGEAKEAEGASQVEAGKRLEELRRRRGETESEEFEKLKQKQQEAALELEELKKKREERRKVLEEEEQRRKQEEADRKVREEEEKRRLKEEIERRRAEAAEKRQKMPEDGLADDKKPFKCFTPKGSSLKIEERAEFLNKSVQKSGVKSTHQAAVVSKIDSRLEQYTSAIEGTKTAKPTKPAASDLPVPAEGVRNMKSMWEKGNVFSSPAASGTPNKETAGLKVGVSSRINEWLTKTPDGNKSPAPKPSYLQERGPIKGDSRGEHIPLVPRVSPAPKDLRPGDVSGKRNLWEKQSVDKVTSPTKDIYDSSIKYV